MDWRFVVRVGITGASGFLSAWFARALISQGHDPILITRPASDLWRLAGLEEVLEIHSADPDGGDEFYEDLGLDVLVLNAWVGVSSQARHSTNQDVNYDLTLKAVNSAIKAGVKQIVGLGSQDEFGSRREFVRDSTETSPDSEYGKTKIRIWKELRHAANSNGVEATWMRIYSAFGPLMHTSGLIPNLVGAKLRGVPFEPSSPNHRWGFLHASDVASALCSILESGESGKAFNVSSGVAPSVSSVVNFVLGHTPTIEMQAKTSDSNGLITASTTENLNELGWKQEIQLEDALAEYETWVKGGIIRDRFLNIAIPNPS